MPKPARQVRSGQAYRVRAGDIVREVCCACGSAHLVKYEVAPRNYVTITAWLDKSNRMDK